MLVTIEHNVDWYFIFLLLWLGMIKKYDAKIGIWAQLNQILESNEHTDDHNAF